MERAKPERGQEGTSSVFPPTVGRKEDRPCPSSSIRSEKGDTPNAKGGRRGGHVQLYRHEIKGEARLRELDPAA